MVKKPIHLIKQLVSLHPKPNAVVLDFFAGSGSTGHAVLDLNQEDDGNRKFILCTNNENNICEDITYKRLSNVINGFNNKSDLPGSLKYFKTDFVENNSTRDQIYFDLTEKCVPMLCVKESTFDLVEKTDSYVIYKDKNSTNYTCIYYDILHNNYDEFIEKIKYIENKKALYIFSLNNRVEEYELEGINNYKVEAIPQKIYDLYRKLVKLSKEN
jgi:adenine-specific DNA-methyltransferase